MDACLGNDTLVDLIEGRVSPRTRERLCAHASRCASCREVLSSLARDVAAGSAPAAVTAAPRATELPIGGQVGRYIVQRHLGSGGMGVVYAAHDPELGRTVAIKLLRPEASGPQVQERLRREAQAMAQLAHPNVVAIHDVGARGDQIFIAMEYLEGETLEHWLATPRSVRAVIESFVAAGSGLAAAHAAGLVHRDFKPENVLRGTDGRIRVGDFGLARHAATEHAPGSAAAAFATLRPDLTATGELLGTPYFMAPEQHRGEPADARSDQFSFCVALYGALYGCRPFEGDSVAQLSVNVQAGRIRTSPPTRRVSRRVGAAIRRGLAPRPDDRFPSMDALIRELARPPRRWQFAAIAGAAAVAAGAAVIALRPAPAPPPCRGAAAQLRGTWNADRRAAIQASFTATGAPFAAAAGREVARLGDAYAAQWIEMHTAACEATRVRGDQTEDVLGLRMACLDDRRRELGALAGQLATADRSVAERAVAAAAALSPIDACGDVAALTSPIRVPADPATRQRVAATRAQLAEVRASRAAGRYLPALAAVRPLISQAGAIGYRPLEAEALELAGLLAEDTGGFAEARPWLDQAALAAEAGRHDTVVAAALTASIVVIGNDLGRFAEVGPLEQRARAAIERVGKPPELTAALLQASGTVEIAAGKFADARRDVAAAVALIEAQHGAHALALVEPLRVLGHTLIEESNGALARPYFERSLAIQRARLGDDHPDVARTLEALASADYMTGDLATAVTTYERARGIYERTFGPESSQVAHVLGSIGLVYSWQGKSAEALELHRRAVAIEQATLGPEHLTTLSEQTSLAAALEELDRHDEALAVLTRVLALETQQLGAYHPRIAETLAAIAFIRLGQRQFAAARDTARAAYDQFSRAMGDAYQPYEELRIIGEALLELGQPAQAIEPLEHAARSNVARDPGTTALLQALLGRALLDANRDAARGRALIDTAWQTIATDDRMTHERAQLERWMKLRRFRPRPASPAAPAVAGRSAE